MNTVKLSRVAESLRPTDGCRTGRPQPRQRGSRSHQVRTAVRESIGR